MGIFSCHPIFFENTTTFHRIQVIIVHHRVILFCWTILKKTFPKPFKKLPWCTVLYINLCLSFFEINFQRENARAADCWGRMRGVATLFSGRLYPFMCQPAGFINVWLSQPDVAVVWMPTAYLSLSLHGACLVSGPHGVTDNVPSACPITDLPWNTRLLSTCLYVRMNEPRRTGGSFSGKKIEFLSLSQSTFPRDFREKEAHLQTSACLEATSTSSVHVQGLQLDHPQGWSSMQRYVLTAFSLGTI